jgi:hypothetical protein
MMSALHVTMFAPVGAVTRRPHMETRLTFLFRQVVGINIGLKTALGAFDERSEVYC